MKHFIVTCLIWAALCGTALAQDAAYSCAMACDRELGPSCHERSEVLSCLRSPGHAECQATDPDASELLRQRAAMILFGRMHCGTTPTTSTRRTSGTRRTHTATTTTVVTPASTTPTEVPAPRDPSGLTYVTPHIPIIGDGPAAHDERARRAQQQCVELGGVWYAEGRTADPSRERLAALVEHEVNGPNAGPGGGPADDDNPGVCLTPEGVVLIEVLRREIDARRAGDEQLATGLADLQRQINALNAHLTQVNAQSLERDQALRDLIRQWSRHLAREHALHTCVSGQISVRVTYDDGTFEDLPCETPDERAIREGRATNGLPASATSASTDAAGRQRVQLPTRDPNRHRLTGERLGFIGEAAFSVGHYQLVAHQGSHSPKFIGLGAGLTIRLADHVYLAGVIDLGVGMRDGEHVRRLFEAHYRAGVLGVAANHLLLGASYYAHHRYSGSDREEGPWYQYRNRGLELEAGFIWRERGWSPFFSAQLGLGQGCHANRATAGGQFCAFDPSFGLRVGVTHLRAR